MSGMTAGAELHPGIAVLDFGLTPSPEASVAVTDQIGITVTSHVRVWIQQDTMGSGDSYNDETDHLMAAALLKLGVSKPVADDGFTIYADSIGGLATGRFRVKWVWSV